MSNRKKSHRGVNEVAAIERTLCKKFKSFMIFLAENSKCIIDVAEETVISNLKNDFNVNDPREVLKEI